MSSYVGLSDGAWSSASLLSAQQSNEVEHIRISNHFVPTRAAASLSSRLNRLDGSQESQRIRDGGQARLAHTCDSFSESLKATCACGTDICGAVAHESDSPRRCGHGGGRKSLGSNAYSNKETHILRGVTEGNQERINFQPTIQIRGPS